MIKLFLKRLLFKEMSNVKANMVILLVVFFTTNGAFTQSTEQPFKERLGKILFTKQNSLTYQNGIINYFYDKDPVIINISEIKNIPSPLRLANDILIKSRGINYTRNLNDKSNITIVGSRFQGGYASNSRSNDNSLFPLVTYRTWYFVGLEYNRLFIEKSKFKLFYGGGLNYRKGFEYYKVLSIQGGGSFGESIGEGVRLQNIGATLNLNMRYSFWKRFFFFSKIDIQGYFQQADVVTQDFKELNDRWQTREFKPSSRINHTLTIGIGVDF